MTHALIRHPTVSIVMRIQAYAGAIALVALSTLVGLWVAPRWGTDAVDMIYLPAVLAAAALWGLGPALLSGAGAALAYNFFFTEPVHTFRMNRADDVVTVIVLLSVALVTSKLAAALRDPARIAAAHAARNATIAGLAHHLLSCSSEEDIARSACGELNRLFQCNAMIIAGMPAPHVVAAVPDGNRLTPSDIAAGALTIETGEPAGRGTSRSQPAEWQFHAVRSADSILAAAGLARDDGSLAVTDDDLPLLNNLLDQLALALERARLDRQTRDFAAVSERDRVRATLLSSIGQDIRPSLDSIGGAVRALKRAGASDKALLTTIGGEAQKLDRYSSNLVELGPVSDQKPIEAGGINIDLFQRAVTKDGREIHLP